ncbi:hypothetical protein QBC45DRAFT_432544 [Copromyces sp. CBS 386.78]|nr:hypothetical protein QBC45DRAFT_432544 [Copromyces sp. CBS 386.78]
MLLNPNKSSSLRDFCSCRYWWWWCPWSGALALMLMLTVKIGGVVVVGDGCALALVPMNWFSGAFPYSWCFIPEKNMRNIPHEVQKKLFETRKGQKEALKEWELDLFGANSVMKRRGDLETDTKGPYQIAAEEEDGFREFQTNA